MNTTVVVGAAIVRDGRVLAARRTRPPALAGRWELPGGRVEPPESERAALRRECAEELGVQVDVHARVGHDVALDEAVLRVYAATLRPGGPAPRAVEHAELRWIGPDELNGLDWLDADRALLPQLAALLASDSRRGPTG